MVFSTRLERSHIVGLQKKAIQGLECTNRQILSSFARYIALSIFFSFRDQTTHGLSDCTAEHPAFNVAPSATPRVARAQEGPWKGSSVNAVKIAMRLLGAVLAAVVAGSTDQQSSIVSLERIHHAFFTTLIVQLSLTAFGTCTINEAFSNERAFSVTAKKCIHL